jgi:hypothetical protein
VAAIERAHQATQAYYRQLEERLTKLPAEIAKGISPEAIAAKITESVRQQFVQTGLPETARALGVAAKQIKQCVGEFDRTARQLTDSYSGVSEQARRAIDNMRATISSATDFTTRAVNELSSAFSADYKWSIATFTMGAFLLGLVLGVVLQWWITPRQEAVQEQPAPAAIVQPQQPSDTTASSSKPAHKKRVQSRASSETR